MGITHQVKFITLISGLFLISIAHAGPKDFERNMDVAPPDFIKGGTQSKPVASSPADPTETAPRQAPTEHAVDQSQLHWTYEDPAKWGDIDSTYHLCKDGKRQSPIDINDSSYANLGDIHFKYRSGPKEILNNGHTIQVNMHSGSYITVSGKRYDLLQFHFHSPSEHTINGKPAPMVMHFVHQASDDQLAVIAVLMERCKENSTIDQLWQRLPAKLGQKIKLSQRIKIHTLIPANRNYYNYSGSLTTPPCSEGVNWMVLKRSVEVSASQIEAFTSLFPKSTRPLQQRYHRPIRSRN